MTNGKWQMANGKCIMSFRTRATLPTPVGRKHLYQHEQTEKTLVGDAAEAITAICSRANYHPISQDPTENPFCPCDTRLFSRNDTTGFAFSADSAAAI
jgi:hypothetical protein